MGSLVLMIFFGTFVLNTVGLSWALGDREHN
jgi:hypothetical protein